ncbi:ImmA/IrrE family metallo-endopeptidase [Gemmatimonas sp.]|uniref:ImmA/IrrE family metallo-endopeptidase n=1 Tax=Gemmatimonas sp. TaxID=1962908 RepID=UPI00286E5768|nr:ImmA/IrrE family metallo-endopeptidase [Gemmatimonas sp.]
MDELDFSMRAAREYAPDFDADERLRAAEPRRKMARDAALALLKQHKVTMPAVDVEALARACGLAVVFVEVEGKLSGQLYPDQREIVINTRGRSRERQRFTLAHELGHWRLTHHLSDMPLPADTLGYSGVFEQDSESEGRSAFEIEANTFASELLIPSPWIRKIAKPLSAGLPQQLAQTYDVSREAMFYQLMRCGRFT